MSDPNMEIVPAAHTRTKSGFLQIDRPVTGISLAGGRSWRAAEHAIDRADVPPGTVGRIEA